MNIGNLTLPNPVSVQVNGHTIGTVHSVPTGTLLCRRKRYPATGAPYTQERHLIRLTFADLTTVECAALRTAYAALVLDYLVLSGVPGLGLDLPLPGGGVTVDAAYVTLAPGTRMSIQAVDGWTERAGVWYGPVLLNAELSLISGDVQLLYGN